MKKLKPENTVQKEIIDLIEYRGGYVFKVIRANMKGVSDLIACYKGFFIAIEVKKEGSSWDDATKLQKKQIEWVREAKGIGEVCSSVDEVKRILDKIDTLMIL